MNRLAVVHYHLRPGGVRRVLELALPAIARRLRLREVVLAVGEPAPDGWTPDLGRTALRVVVEPAFRYAAEQRTTVRRLRERLAATVPRVLAGAEALWVHNPALARNVPLIEAIAGFARAQSLPAVFHHHDFFFDHRPARLAEALACGFGTPAEAAAAVLPPGVVHATLTRADQRALRGAVWLPNPVPPARRISSVRRNAARRWLRARVDDGGPIWLAPTRLLRRKNLAEALLLARWLNPDGWLVTTGGPSSAEERPYARELGALVRRQGLRARLAVCAGPESPPVSDLIAASDAVVLTSLFEGFGLPLVEAAQAKRPLLARALPNVLPDLKRAGFGFPQIYEEVWIAPGCLGRSGPAVAFARLSLDEQLRVLAMPAERTWAACAPHNPRLRRWRAAEWPAAFGPASSNLAPVDYARRFAAALATEASRRSPVISDATLARRLAASYPLLAP